MTDGTTPAFTSDARPGDHPGQDIATSADNSIRELIAFYEIIDRVSTDKPKSAGWYTDYLSVASTDERTELSALLRQTAQALIKSVEHVEQAQRGEATEPFERIVIKIPSKLQIVVDNLLLDVTHRSIPNRVALTSRAFLIAAESSFEVLFGKLVREIYKQHPAALARSEYAFTLEELTKFASIEDARNALINRKIDSLLRDGINEWDKWLQRTIKLDFSDLIDDWPKIREVFARRNILVHTDGNIDEHYLSELRSAGIDTSNLIVGQDLIPSVDYLKDALERLIALEALLGFRLWSRLHKGQLNHAAKWVSNIMEFLVLGEMWTATYLISEKLGDANCRRDIQLSIQVYGWLAQKRQGRLDAVEDKIRSWDVTGLSIRYAVEKDSLLGEISDAELLGYMNSGIVTPFEVAAHPLFAEYRHIFQPTASVESAETQQSAEDETSGRSDPQVDRTNR